jgi:16S rRNA (guanine527-N7)-methyltransferase
MGPDGLKHILNHFPNLTEEQIKQFAQLYDQYIEWNSQINVISRKDLDEFYIRHVLHALGIAKVMSFQDGSKILDIGTGGGFPGIPLAILFPQVQFTLVDSIGKKIKVVKAICDSLEIKNVTAIHERAENVKGKFDFVVSRAVTAMERFIPWCKGKFANKQNNSLPNGILYLKGGDLSEEMKPVQQSYTIYPLTAYFENEFFETKQVVYVNMS